MVPASGPPLIPPAWETEAWETDVFGSYTEPQLRETLGSARVCLQPRRDAAWPGGGLDAATSLSHTLAELREATTRKSENGSWQAPDAAACSLCRGSGCPAPLQPGHPARQPTRLPGEKAKSTFLPSRRFCQALLMSPFQTIKFPKPRTVQELRFRLNSFTASQRAHLWIYFS